MPLAVLPVGFEQFHRRAFLNYQFNRAHALGFADRAELHEAASQRQVAARVCIRLREPLRAGGRRRPPAAGDELPARRGVLHAATIGREGGALPPLP